MSLLSMLRGTAQHFPNPHQTGRYYVYELRYPNVAEFGKLADRVFYVGKGSGDRLLQHEQETRRILKSGQMMRMKHKHKAILSIWDAGYDVLQVIVYRTDNETDAYLYESEIINRIGLERLTNETYGWRPRKRRR